MSLNVLLVVRNSSPSGTAALAIVLSDDATLSSIICP